MLFKKSNEKEFYKQLENRFGKPDEIKKLDCDLGTPIVVFYYNDLPEKGYITSITYGLSEYNHPKWINSRPEIIVTLKSNDLSWGFASAYFISEFRGDKTFSYGDIFTMDEPISKESKMSGFFVFAPSILNNDQSTFNLPTKKIVLSGMYPIYKEEREVINEIGLKEFWHHKNFDMYDVNREQIKCHE